MGLSRSQIGRAGNLYFKKKNFLKSHAEGFSCLIRGFVQIYQAIKKSGSKSQAEGKKILKNFS